jgi:hypothetical protein
MKGTSSQSIPLIIYEQEHLFLAFCSFVTLSNSKKMNLANVFLLVLQNKDLRELFKRYCDINSDFGAVQAFLSFDQSLYKSKYVMKYLNSVKNKITI